MDIEKFVAENGLSDFPIGLAGCRISDFHFDLCEYDIVIFDGKSEPEKIIKSEGEFVMIHHASLSETLSKKLLQYDKLQIIQDESWDLRMLLSKMVTTKTGITKMGMTKMDTTKMDMIIAVFLLMEFTLTQE